MDFPESGSNSDITACNVEKGSNESPTATNHKINGTTPKDVKPVGSLCEIKVLVEHVVKGETKTVERETYLSSKDKAQHSEYAIVAKQVYNDKARLEKTVVEINSPQLYSVLQELVKYYPEKPLQFKTGVTFDSPFKLLTHYRTDLAERTSRRRMPPPMKRRSMNCHCS